jgi:hypothetical protein
LTGVSGEAVLRRTQRSNTRDHGRFSAALFAATVVITGGGGVCLMIALVFAQDVRLPLTVVGSGLGGLLVLMWLLIDRPVRRVKNSNIYTAQKESLADYVESFEPRHRRPGRRSFGTNAPPSVDSLRQIREDSNAWCPSDRRVEEYRKSLKDSKGE